MFLHFFPFRSPLWGDPSSAAIISGGFDSLDTLYAESKIGKKKFFPLFQAPALSIETLTLISLFSTPMRYHDPTNIMLTCATLTPQKPENVFRIETFYILPLCHLSTVSRAYGTVTQAICGFVNDFLASSQLLRVLDLSYVLDGNTISPLQRHVSTLKSLRVTGDIHTYIQFIPPSLTTIFASLEKFEAPLGIYTISDLDWVANLFPSLKNISMLSAVGNMASFTSLSELEWASFSGSD